MTTVTWYTIIWPPVDSALTPVISSGNFDDTTDTSSFTVDQPGTLYWVIDALAASKNEVLLGKGGDGTAAEASDNFAITAGTTEFDADVSGVSPDGTRVMSIVVVHPTGGPSDVFTLTVTIDNTAPVLSGVSTVTDFGSIFVNWSTDEGEGTARAVAVPAGDPEPSEAQKLAGENSAGSAAAGDSGLVTVTQSGAQKQLGMTGLTVGNDYDVYIIQADTATNTDTASDLAVTVVDNIPGTSIDTDAQAFIFDTEDGDGQVLEQDTRLAYDTFIKGLKTDAVWDAIKAAAILAGARTLDGALRRLKGDDPTNTGFVSGDYVRKTGLKGDGTSYLSTGRNNDADPQDNQCLGVYLTAANTLSGNIGLIGAGVADTGTSHVFVSDVAGKATSRSQSSGSNQHSLSNSDILTGYFGISRDNAANYDFRVGDQTDTFSEASEEPFSQEVVVFGRDGNGDTDARIAFYVQGEALDQALLESRIDTLITDLDGAIP